MPCLLRSGLLVLLSASLAAPALGAPPAISPAPPAFPSPNITDHVARAEEARRAGRLADAAVAYQAALTAAEQAALPVAQRAALLGELGLCDLALGRHRDAAEHLHLALQHREELRLEQQLRLEQGQKKAEREVAMLFISADPPDAEVLVDGKTMGSGRQSYLAFVEPGVHTVRARLDGHVKGVATVDAPRGGSSSISMRLDELPPKPRLTAAPAAPAPVALQVGPRDETANRLRVVGVVAASTGVVLGASLAIAGEVLDSQAETLSGTLGPHACNGERGAPECEDLHGTIQTRDALDRTAVGSFIASGAIGVLTLTSLWWAPSRPAVVPVVTDRQAGVVLVTTW